MALEAGVDRRKRPTFVRSPYKLAGPPRQAATTGALRSQFVASDMILKIDFLA